MLGDSSTCGPLPGDDLFGKPSNYSSNPVVLVINQVSLAVGAQPGSYFTVAFGMKPH